MLGTEHPGTQTSRSNLANTLRDLGELTGAKVLHQQNLEIRERMLGAEHPSTTKTTWHLLRTVVQLDGVDAAAPLIEKLRWLVDRSEESIESADQREIRQDLIKYLKTLHLPELTSEHPLPA